MRRETALLIRLRSADVVGGHLESGHEFRVRPRIASRRNALEDVLRQDRLLDVRFGVDRRRVAGDGNRFRDVAHFELGVDRRHERGVDADVVALHRAESLQLELEVIRTRRQTVETVASGRIGGLRLDTADQPLAGKRDGRSGKHRIAAVRHRAGNRPALQDLCVRRRGQQQRKHCRQERCEPLHICPPRLTVEVMSSTHEHSPHTTKAVVGWCVRIPLCQATIRVPIGTRQDPVDRFDRARRGGPLQSPAFWVLSVSVRARKNAHRVDAHRVESRSPAPGRTVRIYCPQTDEF